MILITAKTPIATLSENGISKVLQSMTEITRNIEKDEDFFIKNLEKQKVLEILKIIRKNNLYTTITVSGNIITDTQK